MPAWCRKTEMGMARKDMHYTEGAAKSKSHQL